ncbi:MAG TPA: hypothetical protein VGQ51_03460 [Puia sp.]|nr:hypothetical protein [Puia sp.]
MKRFFFLLLIVTIVSMNNSFAQTTFWSVTGNTGQRGDTSFVGTIDSNRLAFRTKNREHMSISPTGTVAVGTETELDSLTLNGPMYIWDSVGIDPLSIESNNDYGSFVNFTNASTYYAASIGLRFYNSAGIVSQMFVGSPSSIYAPNGFGFQDLSGGGFDFSSRIAGSFFSWGSDFKAAGGSKMIFYTTPGHLIIGSTTDSGNSKLQVRGNAWMQGLTLPTGAASGYVLTSDTAGNASWQPGSSGRWAFANGSVFDSSDNIAIGTSNPQGYKLAVNGTAMFTKIKVRPLSSWPDYVFRKGYVLPGLEELEAYVNQYHHLPGITSEDEVKQDGIDLGEQHTALLKKVEELTLYLLNENRSLKDQIKELSEQKSQLAEQNARLQAQQKEIDDLKAMIQANTKH